MPTAIEANKQTAKTVIIFFRIFIRLTKPYLGNRLITFMKYKKMFFSPINDTMRVLAQNFSGKISGAPTHASLAFERI
jgi:hypothetical protein